MRTLNLFGNRSPDWDEVSDLRLWFGVLGGAIAWLIHLLLAYGIAEFGCVSGLGERHWLGVSMVAWLEAVLSILSLSSCLFACWVARQNSQSLTQRETQVDSDAADARMFMARSGVLSNRLFVLIIAVQSIPFIFYWNGC